MGMLDGKTGLVFGVANQRSIAWAIAQALHSEGAGLAFTFQGERLEAGVRTLVESTGSSLVLPCDVTRDEELDAVFQRVESDFGGLDILIHAVAFAAREDINGRYLDTARANHAMALDISAYSLTAMAQRAEPLMRKVGGGSIVAMTYLGGERAVPNYNVMGIAKAALEAEVRQLALDLGEANIRVNAVSAGPIRTLSARAITGFGVMEEHYQKRAPLRRNVSATEVAQVALFLCSPMASGVTGEVIHCDGGYHAVGF